MSELVTYKRATPLIKRIQNTGGSFYTFPSAAEDLNLAIGEDSSVKFRFSRFGLLNIPNIKNTTLGDGTTAYPAQYSNTIRLDAIPGAYDLMQGDITVDKNVQFAESFQNYCLNLESTILASSSYDSSAYETVSERVFFKWLKEVGSIRFQPENSTALSDVRFSEEPNDDSKGYSRVVQYIGNIDYVDKYSGSENAYNSVYVHVPLETGNTPSVLFKTVSDDNYEPGKTYYRLDEDENSELILGREIGDSHPDGLSLISFYDNDSGIDANVTTLNSNGPTLFRKNLDENGNTISLDAEDSAYKINDWWYLGDNPSVLTSTNSFLLESSQFNDSSNDDLAIYNYNDDATDLNGGSTRFLRSRLDGIEIDFDAQSYSSIDNLRSFDSLVDVARSSASKSYKFNAILLYYDLYENIESVDADGNLVVSDEVKATNLFGVLFLDRFRSEIDNGYGISRFEKCKPNEEFNLNGNSFGFRLNFKVNLNTANPGVETEVQISDSNTLSMDIFHDTLLEMSKVSNNLVDYNKTLLTIEQRLRDLEEISTLLGPNSVAQLNDKIDEIAEFLTEEGVRDALTEKQELINLIQNNYKLLYSILEGKTNLKVAFDLGTLNAGSGINLLTEGQNMTIDTYSNQYSYGDSIYVHKNTWSEEYDTSSGSKSLTHTKTLQPNKNYIRFSDDNDNTTFQPDAGLKIYIDDTVRKWQTGQVIRLYFKTPYDLKSSGVPKYLNIYTDGDNTLKRSKAYSVNICSVSSNEFESRNYKPVIEIHCIDANGLLFEVDYLN